MFKYMTKQEFEVFSPLYYTMDYEEYSKNMVEKPLDNLIQEAIDKKKIDEEDGERIQKNIDTINFVSPKGREQAIISCIKHMAKCKSIIKLAIREDKKVPKINSMVHKR